MIDFSDEYTPIEKDKPFVTIRELESDLLNYLSDFGYDFGVSHLGSYHRFSRKATGLVNRFISSGLSVTINIEDSEDFPRIISTDAVFPSGFEQPYIEYYIDKNASHFVSDPSSPYAVITSAIRRGGKLKGRDEKIMAYDTLPEIDSEGFFEGEFLMEPRDIPLAKKLVERFR